MPRGQIQAVCEPLPPTLYLREHREEVLALGAWTEGQGIQKVSLGVGKRENGAAPQVLVLQTCQYFANTGIN